MWPFRLEVCSWVLPRNNFSLDGLHLEVILSKRRNWLQKAASGRAGRMLVNAVASSNLNPIRFDLSEFFERGGAQHE